MASEPQPPDTEREFERSWRQRFERFGASRQDDAGIAGWSAQGLDVRLRHFTRVFHGRPGGLWLEAGCGAGTYCRWLAGQGQRVLGIDYSHPSLVKARQRSAAEIPYVAADVHHLPVRTGVFDGVLCYGVLQALGSSGQAVRELARGVRPGGWLLVDGINAGSLYNRWTQWDRRRRGLPPYLRYEDPGLVIKLFEELGFARTSCDWIVIAPGRLSWLQGVIESAAMRWLLRHLPGFGSLLAHSFVIRGMRQPVNSGW